MGPSGSRQVLRAFFVDIRARAVLQGLLVPEALSGPGRARLVLAVLHENRDLT